MIVYHGSTEIIKNPDVIHSKKYLDFGRSFLSKLEKSTEQTFDFALYFFSSECYTG